MSKSEDADVLSAARAVLEYLKTNPQAKDNLDGVAKWWLQREKKVVLKALHYLLAKNAINFDSRKGLYYGRADDSH